MKTASLNSWVWMAFLTSILLGGLNVIGVRFIVMELAPFWGAAIRFAPASLLLFLIVIFKKMPLPAGRAWIGALIYGFFNFGISYIFLYWGLQQVQAGIATVMLALGPLLTLLLAALQRQEVLRWSSLLGALLSMTGAAVVFLDSTNSRPPILPLLAVFLGALCLSEASIIIKKYPSSHPITTNAIAMAVGALTQLIFSIVVGEAWSFPAQPQTWAALGYLILFGSIALFVLVIFILRHWPASRTSYILVLMPFVTLPASALLDGEQIGWVYLVGMVLVVAGVYLGAIARQRKPEPVSSPVA